MTPVEALDLEHLPEHLIVLAAAFGDADARQEQANQSP